MSRRAKSPEVPAPVPSRLPNLLLVLGFFVAVFLYVCLRIQPAVEYEHHFTLFFFGQAFWERFSGRPGGMLEYATAFLAQLNHENWLGALVFAGLALALFLAGRRFFRAVGGLRTTTFALLPILALLAFRERFDPHYLLLTTGIVVATAFAAAWSVLRLRIPGSQTWVAPALAVPFVSFLFYAAGLWPCLLFTLLLCLFELFQGRRILTAIGCLLPGAAALSGTLLLRGPDPDHVLNPWGTGLPLIFTTSTYTYFPLCAACLGILADRRRKKAAVPHPSSPRSTHRHSTARAQRSMSANSTSLFARLAPFTILAVGWFLVWVAFNAGAKRIADMHFDANHQRWDHLVQLAAHVPREDMDAASELRLQLGLFHTGRLCEDLFAFRNQTTWEVLPGLGVGAEACRAQAQVLFRLGLVNDAEHYAHEALEFDGEDPELLRLLAEVNLVKGRPRAARVFLCVLDRVPFQQDWSQARLDCLQSNSPWPNEDELSAIRRRMLTNDLAHNTLPAEGLLRQLLRCNRENKMAYEYLLAHYLLTLQLSHVLEMLGGLADFPHTRIPRHVEEAILLYKSLTHKQVDLHGRAIRPETLARFERYSQALEEGAVSTSEGRAALTRDFGDTYWYYCLARSRPK